MRDLSSLVAFVCIWGVIIISPGPDFLMTIRFAITRSRRAALVVVLGICTGTTIWAVTAAMGAAVVLAREHRVADVIRWCGTAYLITFAVRIIRGARRPITVDGVGGGQQEMPTVPERWMALWRTGLLANLSNPKAAIFWSSLFATTIPKGASNPVLAAAAIIAVLIAGFWYGATAIVLSLDPVMRQYQRAKRWIDYLTGGILTSLALRLALES